MVAVRQLLLRRTSDLHGGPAAIVNASGSGTHTTLAAAIAAVPAGSSIVVTSNLTITSTIVINKQVDIDFTNHVVYNAATSAGIDTIASSVPVGSNGQINFVKLRNVTLSRSGPGQAGKGINFHGCYHWTAEHIGVNDHEGGVYFDATPWPSGMGSMNVVKHLIALRCGKAIHCAGTANINSVYEGRAYSCGWAVYHESGLNLRIFGLVDENTVNAVANERIYCDAIGLYVYGWHGELGGASPYVKLGPNANSVHIHGYAYGGTGDGGADSGYFFEADDAANNYTIALGNNYMDHRSHNRGPIFRSDNPYYTIPVASFFGKDALNGPDIERVTIKNGGLRLVPISTLPVSPAVGDMVNDDGVFKYWDGTVWQAPSGSGAHGELSNKTVLPTISATTTLIVHRDDANSRLRELMLWCPAAITFSAGNYWTIDFYEYHESTQIGLIGRYTQAAAINAFVFAGLSGQDYAMASGNLIVAVFTKTGTPSNWTNPLFHCRWV